MANQRQIWKQIKRAGTDGLTATEIKEMFPQSDEELASTLKRLYSETKIIRTFELRNGDKVIIDIKKMLAFQREYTRRNPTAAKKAEEVVKNAATGL